MRVLWVWGGCAVAMGCWGTVGGCAVAIGGGLEGLGVLWG